MMEQHTPAPGMMPAAPVANVAGRIPVLTQTGASIAARRAGPHPRHGQGSSPIERSAFSTTTAASQNTNTLPSPAMTSMEAADLPLHLQLGFPCAVPRFRTVSTKVDQLQPL